MRNDVIITLGHSGLLPHLRHDASMAEHDLGAWFFPHRVQCPLAACSWWCLNFWGCFALWCCYPCPHDWRTPVTTWTVARSSGGLLSIACCSQTAHWQIILFASSRSKSGSICSRSDKGCHWYRRPGNHESWCPLCRRTHSLLQGCIVKCWTAPQSRSPAAISG